MGLPVDELFFGCLGNRLQSCTRAQDPGGLFADEGFDIPQRGALRGAHGQAAIALDDQRDRSARAADELGERESTLGGDASRSPTLSSRYRGLKENSARPGASPSGNIIYIREAAREIPKITMIMSEITIWKIP